MTVGSWPKWISVEEKLPEPDTTILVVDGEGYVDMAQYKKDYWAANIKGWAFIDMQDEQPSEIEATHWMPLPEPPIDNGVSDAT